MDIIRSILNNTNANFAKKLLACIRVLSGRSFELLKYALPLFVLTFKFMEWWTNQVKSNSAVDQSNIPAPPEALEVKLLSLIRLSIFNLMKFKVEINN